jgi:hypothetical protein
MWPNRDIDLLIIKSGKWACASPATIVSVHHGARGHAVILEFVATNSPRPRHESTIDDLKAAGDLDGGVSHSQREKSAGIEFIRARYSPD